MREGGCRIITKLVFGPAPEPLVKTNLEIQMYKRDSEIEQARD